MRPPQLWNPAQTLLLASQQELATLLSSAPNDLPSRHKFHNPPISTVLRFNTPYDFLHLFQARAGF